MVSIAYVGRCVVHLLPLHFLCLGQWFSDIFLLLGGTANPKIFISSNKSTSNKEAICACCNQILRFLNFGGHLYYSNFLSWKDESALCFFDFALFHGFSGFVTFFFLFSEKFRKCFTILPEFNLNMWLMKLPKNFEKIVILKIGELVSF